MVVFPVIRGPSVNGTASLFEQCGFRQIGLREVIGGERETAGQSVAWVRMMRTADTLLASFDDNEFQAGLANLENRRPDRPMSHSLALLALQKDSERSL